MLLRQFCAHENSIPICFPTPIRKTEWHRFNPHFSGLNLLRQRKNGFTRMHKTIHIYTYMNNLFLGAWSRIRNGTNREKTGENKYSLMTATKELIFDYKNICLNSTAQADTIRAITIRSLYAFYYFVENKKVISLDPIRQFTCAPFFMTGRNCTMYMHLVGTVAGCVWHIGAGRHIYIYSFGKWNKTKFTDTSYFLDSIILSFCKSKWIIARIGGAPSRCSQSKSTPMNVFIFTQN